MTKLSELIGKYESILRTRGYAESTIMRKDRALWAFLTHNPSLTSPELVYLSDVVGFIKQRLSEGVKESSVVYEVNSLRDFFRWLGGPNPAIVNVKRIKSGQTNVDQFANE